MFIHCLFQFLPREEYAVIFPEIFAAEMWSLYLCTAASDTQYSVRKHQQRDFFM